MGDGWTHRSNSDPANNIPSTTSPLTLLRPQVSHVGREGEGKKGEEGGRGQHTDDQAGLLSTLEWLGFT